MKTNNIATGIIGSRIGGEPKDESEHFYTCSVCNQAVDMRDLGQVFHHEESDHKPLIIEG